MKTQMHRRFIPAVASAMLAAGVALAEDAGKPVPADPSPEQRHKMAEVHQQIADCLLSTRPMSECRSEMHKNGAGMMGKDGCSMMDGEMGSGTMGGGMMQGQGMGPAQDAPSKATPSANHQEHGH